MSILGLQEGGWATRAVSVQRIVDLEAGFEDLRRRGLLTARVYETCAKYFAFELPQRSPAAQSLVIAARSSPKVRVVFDVLGVQRPFSVPPTYSSHSAVDAEARELLAERDRDRVFQVDRARLPLKLLAACSGLGLYGRNNVLFVAPMGSFHQLAAFYTDEVAPEQSWEEPLAMARCQDCTACAAACPTGAILRDRFLLRTESCLTLLNEEPGEFPDWVPASAHNCPIGCLRCQIVCPENRAVANEVGATVTFDETETQALLAGVTAEQLTPDMLERLKSAGLDEYLPVLPRNLSALFADADAKAL